MWKKLSCHTSYISLLKTLLSFVNEKFSTGTNEEAVAVYIVPVVNILE